MRAVKQGRVLTLSQKPSSTHKDFGEIGFHQKPHASYLIFPKPLQEAKGAKVIGIKYDLINESEIKDAVPLQTLKTSFGKKRTVISKQPKRIPTFKVRVRRTAVVEVLITVKAKTKSEARRRAVQSAEEEPFDLAKAVVTAIAT